MTVPMALLALLDGRPSHGFVLKRRYDDLLGHDRELRFGQVYATLARLERDGLAGGVGLQPGGGADRKVYAITDGGVAELDRWLASPQLPGGRPAELFTKVVLALVAHRPAGDVLDAQRAVYLARMRELTGQRASGDAVDRLARDFEMVHLDADLRWIELAVARLADVQRGVDAVLGGGPDE
ncbi:PadR family transcriptional regulator [Cellulomonas sp. P24]|uniref:PadR family transcriptional regulator n=1 Tax=Cellulomonas sp. P24 TaxID=2885206 RepID=UPI00216AFAB0|nr:PadR family transcriptional regulator [Cellulomonas sp. P24]MCR6494766.1 PadR family transcriptional regulator [Cellulomonas sp. P24]